MAMKYPLDRVYHRLRIPADRCFTCPIEFPLSYFYGISMGNPLYVYQPLSALVAHRFPMTYCYGKYMGYFYAHNDLCENSFLHTAY